MNDKELLELAAKAGGVKHNKGDYENGIDTRKGWWNPLTDDGDALRLAVKLRMSIVHDKDSAEVTYGGSYESPMFVVEDNLQDKYAATRRAIVRAAAEIGRTK